MDLVLEGRRALSVAIVAAGLVALVPTAALAASKDVTGTIISTNDEKREWVIYTSSLTGKEQPITVDVSDRGSLYRTFGVGQPISVRVMERESNTYLVTDLISQGSYVDNATFGVQDTFQTQDSSIKAHVGNVPDDDEALAKQQRNSNLKWDEDDDHDNDPTD